MGHVEVARLPRGITLLLVVARVEPDRPERRRLARTRTTTDSPASLQ
jgi:hypothetical protein